MLILLNVKKKGFIAVFFEYEGKDFIAVLLNIRKNGFIVVFV